MFQLGKALVSESLIEDEFVCNLSACKGICCVEGEAGAPVTSEEVAILQDIYPKVKPFLRPEGIEAIEAQGTYTVAENGEFETPLVAGKECAYVAFDTNGTASCGIETAYKSGAVNFQKPISCHLYPERIQEYSEFSAVNYHQWSICSAACLLGQQLKVPVYQFVKDALVRRFGIDWYDALTSIAREHRS